MSVLESAPISSTVGRVFAKDLDEGINAEMKYTIVDGDGADAFDINTDPNFQVGIITVKKVIQIILMESLNVHEMLVRAVVLLTCISSNPLISVLLYYSEIIPFAYM